MSNEIEQIFKDLQNKSQKIIESAIKINTQIETAQVNYKKLQEIALAKFNSSNLEELKTKLATWKEENKKRFEQAKEKVNKLESNYNETVRLIKEIQEGK
jgi:gas vesicle protein